MGVDGIIRKPEARVPAGFLLQPGSFLSKKSAWAGAHALFGLVKDKDFVSGVVFLFVFASVLGFVFCFLG